MPPATDISAQARTWATEIDQVLQTQAQLSRRGVMAMFGLMLSFAVVMIAHGLWTRGSSESAPPLTPSWVIAALTTGTLVVMARVKVVSPWFVIVVMALFSGNQLASIAVSGLAPLVIVTAFVVAYHLLLAPRAALLFSVAFVTTAMVLVSLKHPEVPVELWLRIGVVSALLTVFLQVATLHWRRVSERFRDLSREMLAAEQQGGQALAEAQEEMEARRLTDPVTGLPNQAGIERRLSEQLREPHGQGRGCVMVLSFAGWRERVSALSPPVAAAAERALAQHLQSGSGDEAVVGCAASDEFIVLLPDDRSDGQPVPSRCGTLLQAARRPVHTESTGGLGTEPYAGVAFWPADGTDAAALIRCAQVAGSLARSQGLDGPAAFVRAMQEQASDLSHRLGEIETGIAQRQFLLRYQPIVPSGTGAVRKAEALIRWQHPTRGLVSPGEFIALAEQSALILDLTDMVIDMAAQQVVQWRRTLHPEFQISVNMPPAYLARCVQAPAPMFQRLAALQVPAGGIVLEITEGAVLTVDVEVQQALAQLRHLGFLVSLDDFGVGYSSFGQLPKLRLDFLKLDKTFVDALAHGGDKQAICGAICQLAHDLGMQVVAEGVESDWQARCLHRLQADYLQGYLYSRPLSPEAFVAWAQTRGDTVAATT